MPISFRLLSGNVSSFYLVVLGTFDQPTPCRKADVTHRSKGIFTVTQLSYTFRPRRTPKRAKNPAKPHHFALQALAIRENTTYIHGTPELPKCVSRVYLDIEGLPDRNFYYLIGALIVTEGQESFHSFWADTESDQASIFLQFAEAISGLHDFRVFHFGDYDAAAMKRVAPNLPGKTQRQFEAIIQKSTNVLSLIYPHIYFPTFSNSLKDLGAYLGCKWLAHGANLHRQTGYVWVVTTMDLVHFFYRPSREASFLLEMLDGFSGILVSDFFTGYDSMPCPQQKCLVHLVRDLDDDLLHNPFNKQFKRFAQDFGSLLRPIIETVDRYGLKKRHLGKHKRDVERCLKAIHALRPDSDLVDKYRNRFIKYWPKMFTFLDYDGVPWNNNNAEHAIKRIAKYRRNNDGYFTERSLKEYLVLASVLETCDFNNVNVLKFLLSQEQTLDGLLHMSKRKGNALELSSAEAIQSPVVQ